MNIGMKFSDMTHIGAFANPITNVGGWNQLGGTRVGDIGGGHIIQDGRAQVDPSSMSQTAEMSVPVPIGLLNLQSQSGQPLQVYLL